MYIQWPPTMYTSGEVLPCLDSLANPVLLPSVTLGGRVSTDL